MNEALRQYKREKMDIFRRYVVEVYFYQENPDGKKKISKEFKRNEYKEKTIEIDISTWDKPEDAVLWIYPDAAYIRVIKGGEIRF